MRKIVPKGVKLIPDDATGVFERVILDVYQ